MAHYEPDIESWSYVHQNTGQRRMTHPALPRATLPPPPPVTAFGSTAPRVHQGRQQPANTQLSGTSTDMVPHGKGKEVVSKQGPSSNPTTTEAVSNGTCIMLPPPVEPGPSSLSRKEDDRPAAQAGEYSQYSRKRSASPEDIPTKRICPVNNSTAGFPAAFRPRSPVKHAESTEDTDEDLTDFGDDDEAKFTLPCRRCKAIHSDFRAWGHNYAQCPTHTPAKQRRLQQELELYRSGLSNDQQPHLKEAGEKEEVEALPGLGEQSHIQQDPSVAPETLPGDSYNQFFTGYQSSLRDG
ncbi:hypothetical protein AC578_7839 [Pseudocercospora eumusae]|uniref:Uncharacterized protein n=1 Tax=Pseudocercospora eumusae TaxID=321146 RepID=A0A139HJ01_9PEZI|nr:hypothetical protein AC578_7839 [Pseudocercospora eumusae]